MAREPGYRLEITDRELIDMPRSRLAEWIVPGQFGFEPARRFRCEICIGAGLDPLLRREQDCVAWVQRFTVECDPETHERYYETLAALP